MVQDKRQDTQRHSRDWTQGERIAKYLARAGLGSRREIERYIMAGRVQVNGQVLNSPAFKVLAQDKVHVDGHLVEGKSALRLWRYHKPTGLVTTHRDEKGRATVFSSLPIQMPRVISIGRLDLNSEGLLLLTNDGDLARALELPAIGWVRRYRVRAFGVFKPEMLKQLKNGLDLGDVQTGSVEARLDRQQGHNVWLTLSLREGKNREVRRSLAAFGLTVNRLIRISYGPFQLGQLPRGAVAEVSSKHLQAQVGHLLKES